MNMEHDVASSSARARNGKCVLCNALCCVGCTNVHELALRFFRLIKNLRVALGPMVVPTPAKNNSCKYMKQVSHTACHETRHLIRGITESQLIMPLLTGIDAAESSWMDYQAYISHG